MSIKLLGKDALDFYGNEHILLKLTFNICI